MNVFITGGTGLLGINIVNELLGRGHRVVVLARDPQKAARVLPQSNQLSVIVGDIEEPERWIDSLKGMDAFIHAAAYFREYFGIGDHGNKLESLNVSGPTWLVEAAAARGVQKSVVISSSGVVFPRPDGMPTSETDAPKTITPENAYFESKVKMERSLASITPTLKNSLILVRPGWMFGPNDYAPTGTGQMVIDLLRNGKLQLINGSPMGIADARDVATVTVAALEKVEGFEIYHACGNLIPAIDALRTVAEYTGGKIEEVPLPLALVLSSILEPISRWQNKPNPIPKVGLLTLHRGVAVSSEKAEVQLGVTFRPFSETARDTVSFIRNAFSEQIRRS